MEEVDAEISEMKLFLNGRARFVAEGYLTQVLPALFIYTKSSLHSLGVFNDECCVLTYPQISVSTFFAVND